MKNLFFLLLIPFFSFSNQVSSPALNLNYIGYSNSSGYKVEIKNKQTCGANVSINYNSKSADTVVYFSPGETKILSLQGDLILNSSIKIKTSDLCTSGANAGWISVQVNYIILPTYIENFRASKKEGSINLHYAVNISGGEKIVIERSYDGKAWKEIYSYSNQTVGDEKIVRDVIDHYPIAGLNFYRLKVNNDQSRVAVLKFSISNDYTAYTLSGQAVNIKSAPPGVYVVDGEIIHKCHY